MTRLERIENEVAGLTEGELDAFRAWFEAFDSKRWDEAVERDAASGALDGFADQAIADHRAGRTQPL